MASNYVIWVVTGSVIVGAVLLICIVRALRHFSESRISPEKSRSERVGRGAWAAGGAVQRQEEKNESLSMDVCFAAKGVAADTGVTAITVIVATESPDEGHGHG
jgi:hypothetical protein